MVLVILPDGSLRCVYTEEIPLEEFGPLEVSRASGVEFDPASQEWVARLPEGEEIARGKSRAEVLRKEVEVLESRL